MQTALGSVGPESAGPTLKASVFAQFAFTQDHEADQVEGKIFGGRRGGVQSHGPTGAKVEMQTKTDRLIAVDRKATFSQKCVKRKITRVKGGNRDGNAAVGSGVDVQPLIDRWQSMAHGALTLELRRFYVRIVTIYFHPLIVPPQVLLCIILAPHNAPSAASTALEKLREAAKKVGNTDLTPAWLASLECDAISNFISNVNYRNNKAKSLRATAMAVKKNMGRVATTMNGYESYRGVGKELANLLMLVNTQELAIEWFQTEREDALTKASTVASKQTGM